MAMEEIWAAAPGNGKRNWVLAEAKSDTETILEFWVEKFGKKWKARMTVKAALDRLRDAFRHFGPKWSQYDEQHTEKRFRVKRRGYVPGETTLFLQWNIDHPKDNTGEDNLFIRDTIACYELSSGKKTLRQKLVVKEVAFALAV